MDVGILPNHVNSLCHIIFSLSSLTLCKQIYFTPRAQHIIISLHSGPNYIILLTLRKVLKFMIVSCCNGNDSQSYNEKDMPLSTPGLTLEMLIENEGSVLVVLCSRVAVG